MSAFDTYERRARLYPMLLVLLPTVLGVASWIPTGLDLGGMLGGAVTSVVLAAFLSQVARDQGQRRESELFQKWGGKPSVRALSYQAQFFDVKTLRRVHRALHELDNELRFPESPEEETERHESAFSTYVSASELLLDRTHDQRRFGLVFSENINYGYRRNLWAMKGPGLLSVVLGMVASIAQLTVVIVTASPMAWTALASILIGVGLGSMWIMRVTDQWVRIAADGFARQLCLAAQQLGATRGTVA